MMTHHAPCACLGDLNARLAPHNTEIVTVLNLDGGPIRPAIATQKVKVTSRRQARGDLGRYLLPVLRRPLRAGTRGARNMMPHHAGCACAVCRDITRRGVAIEQGDREMLAAEWDEWISATDGESRKLRAGEDGSPGSPRWVALQAIAATRQLYSPEGAKA